jgi:hypothetical protein
VYDVRFVPPLAVGKVPVTPVVKGKPVQALNTPLVGVPNKGVTNVGLVAKTKAPEPVSPVTAAAKFADDGVPRNVATPVPKLEMPVPPFATFSTGPASNSASILSRSVLILVPQESVEAPTSGLVSNKFVVVESAIVISVKSRD